MVMPLEAPRVNWGFGGWIQPLFPPILYFSFRGNISWEDGVEPSPKIVINLPKFYKKLHCKGDPYWFSGYRDTLAQTDRQTYKHTHRQK